MTRYSGWLFTLVGPAGAGKNHLMHAAMERVSGLEQLPTATTRPMRPGEQEGREHFYLSEPAFTQLVTDNALLEHQVIHGNLYGMLRREVEAALSQGRLVIADIDVFGAIRAHELYPGNAVSIFIEPPSIAALIERMRTRGDREHEIAKRLVRVPMEMAHAPHCTYRILNDDADRASAVLTRMIESVASGQRMAQPPQECTSSCQFRYQVAVVPTYEYQTLTQNGAPLLVPLGTVETQPHREALNAAKQTWGIDLTDAHIIGGVADGTFIPPLSFQCEELDHEELVTFTYQIALTERIDPDGWTWTPLQNTPEPVTEAR